MAYNRINWENDPSTATPLNETNLNKMDKAIYDLDQEIATKADASALADKMDKNNPVGTGSFSMNRKADTIVGNGSSTEGRNCMATKSFTHAEGDNTIAAGYASHSEGAYSMASGDFSHVEGDASTASGVCAHAEGSGTVASGDGSHAEGNLTEATAIVSHAEGASTIAASQCQHVQGKYNEPDIQNIYADIVGNGTDEDHRSNCETTTWDGDKWVAGEITDGNGITLSEVLPTDTESGNPCVITDAFGGKAKSLSLDIEPIQEGSGTPSPDNVRPISGISSGTVTRTGKNLCEEILAGYPDTNQNKIIGGSYTTAVFKGTSGMTVVASADNKNRTALVYCGDTKPTVGGSFIEKIIPEANYYTLPYDGYYAWYICNAVTDNVQVEIGSTATAYEPYNGQTITRTYGQTVYGGSDDVTGSGATVTWEFVEFDGSDDENWSKYGSGSASAFAMIIPVNNGAASTTDDSTVKSNRLQSLSTSATWGSYDLWVSIYASQIVVGIQSITTVDALRSWLSTNPLQVAYKKAIPTSISLASQNIDLLHGDNVIVSNAKTVNVSYRADIQAYIEKKIAEGGNRSLGLNMSKSEPKEEVTEEPVEQNER